MGNIEQKESIDLMVCRLGSKWLDQMVNAAMDGTSYKELKVDDLTFESINSRKILLAYDLNEIGCNRELTAYLEKLHSLSIGSGRRFKDTIFGLLVTSANDQFTKSSARSVIYLLNTMGIDFVGHPIVEATHELENLSKWKKNLGKSEVDILCYLSKVLGEKMRAYGLIGYDALEPEEEYASEPQVSFGSEVDHQLKKIAVIHASDRKTSNTLLLWDMVRPHLQHVEVEELYLSNEVLNDCRGCLFETCVRFAEEKRCFYDDFITRQVLPAVEAADVVVWVCPNYNDTIGARIMAAINRLTVLYRRVKLDHKLMYAIVVSGNSGGDCVASQLIGALNINKGFHLPAEFALIETANSPRSILNVHHVDHRAEAFAKTMNDKVEDYFKKVNT